MKHGCIIVHVGVVPFPYFFYFYFSFQSINELILSLLTVIAFLPACVSFQTLLEFHLSIIFLFLKYLQYYMAISLRSHHETLLSKLC